jgi:hypothetical protein
MRPEHWSCRANLPSVALGRFVQKGFVVHNWPLRRLSPLRCRRPNPLQGQQAHAATPHQTSRDMYTRRGRHYGRLRLGDAGLHGREPLGQKFTELGFPSVNRQSEEKPTLRKMLSVACGSHHKQVDTGVDLRNPETLRSMGMMRSRKLRKLV